MIKNLNLSVIKTLISYIKVPRDATSEMSHINGLLREQEESVVKKWAYFGEYLERGEGYITEKALVYCYVHPFLTPVDINDYQVKNLTKELQAIEAPNCYIKLALAYLLEDAAAFSEVEIMAEDFCFLKEIISIHQYVFKTNYEILMQNLIRNSKANWFNIGSMSPYEVSNMFWSICCSVEFLGTKLGKVFDKLASAKIPESTINTLIKEFGITRLDTMCLNFFCLERGGSDRQVTNSIINTLRELLVSDEDWNDIQKAAFNKIASYRILPSRVAGNEELRDAIRCQGIYLTDIKFENLIHALNNEDFEHLTRFFTVDLFKLSADKVDMLLRTTYLSGNNTFKFLITDNMKNSYKEPEKIKTLIKIYEEKRGSIYNLLESDYSVFHNFVNYKYVDLIKDIDKLDAYNLKRYLSDDFSSNIFNVFKYWFNNGQYKRIIEIIQEKKLTSGMGTRVYLDCEDKNMNREYVDIIANVLAMNETNTQFAYFIYNILLSKEDSLKYFSEEELYSIYSSMKNILAAFPEPKYYGLGSYSIRSLDNLYMSEEDKEKRRQEEEEKKNKEQLAAFHKYLDKQLERAGDKFDKFNAYWSYHIPKFGDKLEYGSIILKRFFPEPEIVVTRRESVGNIMEELGEMFASKLITLQTLKDVVERITIEEEGGNTDE